MKSKHGIAATVGTTVVVGLILMMSHPVFGVDTVVNSIDADVLSSCVGCGVQDGDKEVQNETKGVALDGLEESRFRTEKDAGVTAQEVKRMRLQQIYEENEWKNGLINWILPDSVREAMPHWAESWFRCWVLAMFLYTGVGAAWAYYAYFCFGDRLYPPGGIPGVMDVLEQMKVAFLAMPLYAALPAVTEYIVEQGWTLAYSRVSDVGIVWYIIYFILYMTSVEFFVYWQHRLLHDIRPGYNYLHYIHHKYNKEHTMSPFAGLAFHPLDGILQAIPYTWTLFYVPMHFLTHELLLFATAIWTTNIHDNIHGKVEPIMGARYHTIHHTTYKKNYGHYFIYMDKLFGTLITPEDYDSSRHEAESSTS